MWGGSFFQIHPIAVGHIHKASFGHLTKYIFFYNYSNLPHAFPLLQQNSSELQLVAARTEDMLWWSQPRNPVFSLLLLLVIMYTGQ